VFLELVRQVYVHCHERGQLLDTVRVHLESQLTEARERLAELQGELQQLRKETAVILGTPAERMGRRSTDSGLRDARRAALEQQRVEALANSAMTMPSEMQGALMAKLVGQCEGEAAATLLNEVLGAATEADLLALLSDQLRRLRVTDLMSVLPTVFADLSTPNRQALTRMLVESQDEAERARQAIDICKSLPSQKVGDVRWEDGVPRGPVRSSVSEKGPRPHESRCCRLPSFSCRASARLRVSLL
jgi:hypothetical protein